MATLKEALDLLTAYRREVEALITKHCDPHHPESWLAPEDPRDAYEGVRSAHESLELYLCRLMGQGRAHEWLDPIARGDYEFVKLASPFELGLSEKRRTQRIEHLRWHHETSDLPHDLDALQELLRASCAEPPAADTQMMLTEAAEKWDIPKSAWTKAARKKRDEPGYLPTREAGRTRLVQRRHAKAFATNYLARREQRVVAESAKQSFPRATNSRN